MDTTSILERIGPYKMRSLRLGLRPKLELAIELAGLAIIALIAYEMAPHVVHSMTLTLER